VHSATVLLNRIILGTNSYLTFKKKIMGKPTNSDTKTNILQEEKDRHFRRLGQDINLVLPVTRNKTDCLSFPKSCRP
jgi:predicted house-cleaning NTP pyrophosphatase (Maf/HAM1 superfamily)